MTGIILAGGRGTRLHPLTKTISKQLLPVYDRQMIFWPMRTLELMGATELVIITTPEHSKDFRDVIGYEFKGLPVKYLVQDEPKGIAHALIIAEPVIKGPFFLILGDNLFMTTPMIPVLPFRPTIFTKKSPRPSSYGVAMMDGDYLIEVVEKPVEYIGDDVVTGLYFLPEYAVEIAKNLKPSTRGELEIADVINEVNARESVAVVEVEGCWYDCGTFDDLLAASNTVSVSLAL